MTLELTRKLNSPQPALKTTLPMVDIGSSAFKADSYAYYARLRDESPVQRVIVAGGKSVALVTRYDDVQALLKDEARFAKDPRNAMTPEQLKKRPWIPPAFRAMQYSMLDLDAPEHTRLRAMVHKAFTPRMIEQMRERVQVITDRLLDAAQAKGTFDLIADYALPLPLIVISEILGIPERDQMRFRKWTNALLAVNSPNPGLGMLWPMWRFLRYQRGLIAYRRANPGDDLITALIQAEDAEGGDALNEEELVAMVTILLIAGHETTVNLIGNGTLALLQHRDQWDALRDDPALIKTGVEELMRFYSPVEMATERYARADVEIEGVTIPRGELTLGVLASANHDAAHFDNPDALDITRQNNRHLAFGQGIHYCVGAPLARLEGSIALNTLIRRMPGLKLAAREDQLVWRPGLLLRGLNKLPVRVG